MKRRKTIGQLISTLVFLAMAFWLIFEGLAIYHNKEILKAILVWIGAVLSLLGSLRFVIQNLVNLHRREK